MISTTGGLPAAATDRRTDMTTPSNDDQVPRGGTPLDDAMAGRDAGDEPLVGGSSDKGADSGADGGAGDAGDAGAGDAGADEGADSGADGNDPTTETEEDDRFA
jgi:hypothetical protein